MWFPKDWGNSENVFELSLSEKGLYRELIDLAMLNDNNVEIKKDLWTRKFLISIKVLNTILDKLLLLNLIEINENILAIPSCENRLNLSRNGSIGGKKSKPTNKSIQNLKNQQVEQLFSKATSKAILPTQYINNQQDNLTLLDTLSKATSEALSKATSKAKESKVNKSKVNIKEKSLNFLFDDFWESYGKKTGNIETLKKKWENLNDRDRNLAMEYIPKYKLSQPEKQYRLHPETFLNGKRWNDEILGDEKKIDKIEKNKEITERIKQGLYD